MAKENQNGEFFKSINLDADNDENFDGDNLNEDIIVEMTDAEGNVFYYCEEMIIPVGDDNFAILVGIPNEDEDGEEHHHHCGCGDDDCDCDDEDVIIAKIVLNEDGEEEYIEPTDEEFEAVQKAYEELMYESDED